MLIETLASTFFFFSPNEHPRTRSDQGGRRGGIVRHLAWRNHSKEPDVSPGADRDIATQTQGHWPAAAGPGSKLFMGLGKKGKSFFSEAIRSPQIKSALSFCLLLLFMGFDFVLILFCFAIPKVFILSSHVLLVIPFMVLAFGVLLRKIFSTPKIKQIFTTCIFYFALRCEARIITCFS